MGWRPISGASSKLVFVTASKDETVRAQALQAGAVAVLLRPFSDTVLFNALDAVLQSNWIIARSAVSVPAKLSSAS